VPDALLSPAELNNVLREAFADTIVPTVEMVTEHGVIVRQAITDRHGRPGGTVAGPVLMALADTSAWMAILSRIGPVVMAVTTSLHIDFLRRPALFDLLADARLLKLGSRLAVVDVAITSAGADDLVAKAQVTYSLPPR